MTHCSYSQTAAQACRQRRTKQFTRRQHNLPDAPHSTCPVRYKHFVSQLHEMVNIRSAVFTFQEQQNHRWLKTNRHGRRDGGTGGGIGEEICAGRLISPTSRNFNSRAAEFMTICVAAEVDFM